MKTENIIGSVLKVADKNYMDVGDRITIVNRGINVVIVEKKHGSKYTNFKATDDDGRIWWMRTRGSDYKSNPQYKFLNRVNRNTFEKKQKPHVEQREKEYKQRQQGYETAEKHNLQPGDMVVVNWRSGEDLAQIISVDLRGSRAQIYNSNYVVQSIPLHLILRKDKKARPFKKVFELEQKLQEKQQRRQERRERRRQFRGLW